MTTDRKKLALAYLEAVAKQQYDKIEGCLTPDLRFRGPASTYASEASDLTATVKGSRGATLVCHVEVGRFGEQNGTCESAPADAPRR